MENETVTPSIRVANEECNASPTSRSIIERARNRILIRRESTMKDVDLVDYICKYKGIYFRA